MSIFTKLLDFFNLDNMRTKRNKANSTTVNYDYEIQDDEYDSIAAHYKMDTVKEIEAIPVPTKPYSYICDWKDSIEYVLQRKATEHKRKGNIEAAIACLRKVIELMPYAPMQFPEVYSRLENYLKISKDFDGARKAHVKVENERKKYHTHFTNTILQTANDYEMIKVSRNPTICAECARFHDRVYSKRPNDGYPDMFIFTNYLSQKTCTCNLSAFPIFVDFEKREKKYELAHSNRPFIDDRTPEEKSRYEEIAIRKRIEMKDRQDYDWLLEHLPDKAPKSYSGYRNMKNKNSTNFQKLVALAKEHGYTI